jgi:hypothetical protein
MLHQQKINVPQWHALVALMAKFPFKSSIFEADNATTGDTEVRLDTSSTMATNT